jgi:hypothetical protein
VRFSYTPHIVPIQNIIIDTQEAFSYSCLIEKEILFLSVSLGFYPACPQPFEDVPAE